MFGSGFSSVAQGGNSESFMRGFGMAGVGVAAQSIYKSYTNYDSSWKRGSGLPTDAKGVEGRYDEVWPLPKKVYDANVSGFNNTEAFKVGASWSDHLLRQGGPVSNAVNMWPGGHAISVMHEGFQMHIGALGDCTREVFNLPGMVVSAGVTYPALMTSTPGAMIGVNNSLR